MPAHGINKKNSRLCLLSALPYPDHIKNIDFITDDVLYFDWRSQRYRWDFKLNSIEISSLGVLISNDQTLLMEQCLKLVLI
jgi:hypothetical protein